MKRGHAPIRTCVVCGAKGAKSELVRVALRSDDACVIPDRKQTMEGRGAYVCPGCLPRLSLTKRVQRAFRNRARAVRNDTGS